MGRRILETRQSAETIYRWAHQAPKRIRNKYRKSLVICTQITHRREVWVMGMAEGVYGRVAKFKVSFWDPGFCTFWCWGRSKGVPCTTKAQALRALREADHLGLAPDPHPQSVFNLPGGISQDFLKEILQERTQRNPQFPEMVRRAQERLHNEPDPQNL